MNFKIIFSILTQKLKPYSQPTTGHKTCVITGMVDIHFSVGLSDKPIDGIVGPYG